MLLVAGEKDLSFTAGRVITVQNDWVIWVIVRHKRQLKSGTIDAGQGYKKEAHVVIGNIKVSFEQQAACSCGDKTGGKVKEC